MSDCEDSDFEYESSGEEDSDCESLYLGDENLVDPEPPVTFRGTRKKGFADEEEVDSEIESGSELDSTEPEYTPPSVDTVPDFQPLETPFDPHKAYPRIPAEMNRKSPLAFFKLFVTDDMFNTFVENTNAYAKTKNAGSKPEPRPAGKRLLPWVHREKFQRYWKPTTAKELMVWFGLLIFMGLVKTSRVSDYWKTGGDCQFKPMKQMGLTRFEQLKRFFHLSAPNLPKTAAWYDKIEPFGKALGENSRRYLVPATEVSVDEMMVHFTGRSSHTIKIKNKPIGQGYKLFALCWFGYTLPFPNK